MRQKTALALFALLFSGCVVYAHPVGGPMPEARAVEIAYHFTREPDFFALKPQQSTWRAPDAT